MVLLCDTKDDTSLEQESINLLMDRKVDGLLVAPVGEKWQHLPQTSSLPVVLLDRYFQDSPFPYVVSDNYAGAFVATQSLLELGHTKIACIQGITQTSANQNRVKGYLDALEENGLPESQAVIIGDDYSVENGYQSMARLLETTTQPTAVFALNNQIAIGAMKAISEAGLHIPNDISLLAFDDQPYFDLLSPSLSAVRQPMKEIGRKAVALLFDLLEGKEVQSTKLNTQLIYRSSIRKIH